MVGSERVLYVIACAAPPASEAGQLVSLAQGRGWDVCVLTTPPARRFADVAALERLTGHPVRSEYKNPGEPDVLPEPDAVIAAPATLFGPDVYPMHDPGRGDSYLHLFPWAKALDAIERRYRDNEGGARRSG